MLEVVNNQFQKGPINSICVFVMNREKIPRIHVLFGMHKYTCDLCSTYSRLFDNDFSFIVMISYMVWMYPRDLIWTTCINLIQTLMSTSKNTIIKPFQTTKWLIFSSHLRMVLHKVKNFGSMGQFLFHLNYYLQYWVIISLTSFKWWIHS